MKYFLIIALTLIFVNQVFSNDNSVVQNQRELKKQQLLEMNSEEIKELFQYQNFKKQNSKKRFILENNTQIQNILLKGKGTQLQSKNVFPTKRRVPGEFEELQAVLLSWPSSAFSEDGKYLDPLLPGIGINWINYNTYDYEILPISFYIADVNPESEYAQLWGKLCHEIQKEVVVWIRIAHPDDSTSIKKFMKEHYTELVKYKFIYDPAGQNAFWMRDFGPQGFYFGDQDSLAFASQEYYGTRPIDNAFPEFLAKEIGVKCYKETVETEGGNYMSDGYGTGFYSDVVYGANSDTDGLYYWDTEGDSIALQVKTSLTPVQTRAELANLFNIKNEIVLNQLYYDGGTGHIDIYIKMLDDQTIIATKFPEVYNKKSFTDYAIVQDNLNTIKSLQNYYGNPYRIVDVPLPTDDKGVYSRTSNMKFMQDARGFINGITVNKTFIFPTYSNGVSGNLEGDEQAIANFKKHFPGYNFVGIDSRLLTPMGGAIHCVTMQIPAENPISIKHPAKIGYQSIDSPLAFYVVPYNHSGIKYTELYWRKKGSEEWNKIVMEKNDSLYSYILPTGEFSENDTIQYHIKTESNNGKIAYKPIAAPEGYFEFYFTPSTNISDLNNSFEINVYPNPVSEVLTIDMHIESNNKQKMGIFDLYGKLILDLTNNITVPGDYNMKVNVSTFDSGVYFIKNDDGSGRITMTKLIVY